MDVCFCNMEFSLAFNLHEAFVPHNEVALGLTSLDNRHSSRGGDKYRTPRSYIGRLQYCACMCILYIP